MPYKYQVRIALLLAVLILPGIAIALPSRLFKGWSTIRITNQFVENSASKLGCTAPRWVDVDSLRKCTQWYLLQTVIMPFQ